MHRLSTAHLDRFWPQHSSFEAMTQIKIYGKLHLCGLFSYRKKRLPLVQGEFDLEYTFQTKRVLLPLGLQ